VFTLNIALFVLLFIMTGALIVKIYQLKKRERALNELGSELSQTLDILKDTIKQKKKSGTGADFLKDVGLLSTLVTVIVSKYGNLYLALEDFANVDDKEYVSIYIDPEKKSLILSINHASGQTISQSLINFGTPDDNTFH
jgi:hypothetical protein